MADQEANGWASIIARMRFFARSSGDSHVIETWADELEALLASPGSVSDQGWRTMESAPKDGTEVLVFDEGVMIVSSWVDGPDGTFGWYDNGMIEPPPQFWQPLPAPPVSPAQPKDQP